MKDLFTTGEAAEICRVSQQTIIRCFDAGRLEGFRVPGSKFRRIPRQNLIKFMKDNNIPLDAIDSGKRKILVVDDDTEIGVNWDILSDKNYDIGFRQNFTTSRVGSTIEDATTIGNATAFNTTGLGGAFSVISGSIRNVVHLLQQKRHVEILASPRVMMMSGQSASSRFSTERILTDGRTAVIGRSTRG